MKQVHRIGGNPLQHSIELERRRDIAADLCDGGRFLGLTGRCLKQLARFNADRDLVGDPKQEVELGFIE